MDQRLLVEIFFASSSEKYLKYARNKPGLIQEHGPLLARAISIGARSDQIADDLGIGEPLQTEGNDTDFYSGEYSQDEGSVKETSSSQEPEASRLLETGPNCSPSQGRMRVKPNASRDCSSRYFSAFPRPAGPARTRQCSKSNPVDLLTCS